MNIGAHHLHLRQRVHQKLQPYPHPDAEVRFMDRFIYLISILGPVMTLPQILVIWREKNVAGLSLISWAAYTIFSCVWLQYGVVHKDKPIIITNLLFAIANGLVVVGIILYS